MASLAAITASEVRDHLETVPGLTLPSAMSDNAIIDKWIERMTALVLELKELTALPTSATPERDRFDQAVLDLVLIQAKRYLHPSRPDMLKLLLDEEKLILRNLTTVTKEAPKKTTWGTGLTGRP